MRKSVVVLLSVILVAAFALPAMADTDFSGFIRSKGWMSNYIRNSAGYIVPTENPPTFSWVETRARILMKSGSENVKFTYYGEFDQSFGGQAYQDGRNSGGGLGADTTNLETKNVYVWFKVPDTSWDFKVGVQNQNDSYAGTFFGVADMAGVFTTFKYEPFNFRVGWAKWWENDLGADDDVNLYIAEAKFAFVKDVKLGLNFYYLRDAGSNTFGAATGSLGLCPAMPFESTGYDTLQLYMPGIDVVFKAGPATISGFFFYQFGTFEFATAGASDVDVSGFAGDIRAEVNLGPGIFFLEGLYVSGDDNHDDDKYDGIITASNYNLGESFFYRTDTNILLPNGDDIHTSQALAYDVANQGAGLIHVAAGYSQKFNDKVKGKIGVGYLTAAKKRLRDGLRNGSVQEFAFDTDKGMGIEVNANVNYSIMKGLDLGLYGAYAWLGSAYDKTADGTATQDADDPYMVYARLNYGF